MVLRDNTNFRHITILYFIPNYVQEGIKHINNWSSQLPHTCDLRNQGFHESLPRNGDTLRLYFIHSIGDVLLDLSNIIFIGIDYIHKNKLSITLKYHRFEVVTFEILDFEGYMYEEVDYTTI